MDLVTIKRQSDETDFKSTLRGLRENNVTVKQWQTLSGRVRCMLPESEVTAFASALLIYATKKNVDEYNAVGMAALNQPGG